ncbi:MAG: hypothetical protein P8J37_19160, partial [Fuerstiella sp.]|nr:hypothetical protein [Fuerstiella sp.]
MLQFCVRKLPRQLVMFVTTVTMAAASACGGAEKRTNGPMPAVATAANQDDAAAKTESAQQEDI